MSRTLFLFTLLLAVCALLLGCAKPRPPTITPDTATVTSISPAGLGLRATLNVDNPNDFALSTQGVSATLTLGGKVKLGPINKPHGVSLPGGQTTKVDVDLSVTWNQAAALAALATAGPTIPFEVAGTVKVGGKSLNVELPFRMQGTVSRTELLAAELKGLPSIPGFPVLPQ
jgi:LEA14-like dessication related protein